MNVFTLSSDPTWNNTTSSIAAATSCLDLPTDATSLTACIGNDVITLKNDVIASYPWNNPHNVISKQTLMLIEDVIFCGVNWLLVIVGSAGNVLSCLAFWLQGFEDRMNICLFSLGLVDFCCVVSWFLMGSSCLVSYATQPSQSHVTEWWKWTVRKYVRGLHRGFLFSSGCLTMLIAVERCLCVWMPLRAPTLMGTRSMTVTIVLTVVVVHLVHLVYPFKFDVVAVFDEATNKTLVTTKGTQLYHQHREFFNYVENVVVMTLLPVLTFSVVSIATLLTVVRLIRIVRWRESVADNIKVKNAQVSLVKMLLVVSFMYIITTCPKVILGLVRAFVPEFWRIGNYSNIFQATHQIYLTLGTFNSTVNFFVYYCRSSRFRAELWRVLPRGCTGTAVDKGKRATTSAQTSWKKTCKTVF